MRDAEKLASVIEDISSVANALITSAVFFFVSAVGIWGLVFL